jgi:hypothetical protein
MSSNIVQRSEQDQQQSMQSTTASILNQLVQPGQYVGEVYSIGYETALVQIHDRHRQDVGGIPSLSFLVATRFQPGLSFEDEEASVLLLRVMDAAALPTDAEAERVRVESARRVSGEADSHWDGAAIMVRIRINCYRLRVCVAESSARFILIGVRVAHKAMTWCCALAATYQITIRIAA